MAKIPETVRVKKLLIVVCGSRGDLMPLVSYCVKYMPEYEKHVMLYKDLKINIPGIHQIPIEVNS